MGRYLSELSTFRYFASTTGFLIISLTFISVSLLKLYKLLTNSYAYYMPNTPFLQCTFRGYFLLFCFCDALAYQTYPISTISSTIFIVESLCETSRMVLPLLLSFRAFNIIPSFRESRLLVGSSKRMKGAL